MPEKPDSIGGYRPADHHPQGDDFTPKKTSKGHLSEDLIQALQDDDLETVLKKIREMESADKKELPPTKPLKWLALFFRGGQKLVSTVKQGNSTEVKQPVNQKVSQKIPEQTKPPLLIRVIHKSVTLPVMIVIKTFQVAQKVAQVIVQTLVVKPAIVIAEKIKVVSEKLAIPLKETFTEIKEKAREKVREVFDKFDLGTVKVLPIVHKLIDIPVVFFSILTVPFVSWWKERKKKQQQKPKKGKKGKKMRAWARKQTRRVLAPFNSFFVALGLATIRVWKWLGSLLRR